MFFQSKKKGLWKRLWRARVTTNTTAATTSSMTSRISATQMSNCDDQMMDYQQHSSANFRRNIVTGGGGSANVIGNCCSGNSSSTSSDDLTDQLPQFRQLADKLKERQLETLCQAVESIGGHSMTSTSTTSSSVVGPQVPTDCVLVPRSTIRGEEPHVIACRLWRWPDLRAADEIKRIPSCPNGKDPVYVCCNPNHWSRLCHPETPPPPYCPFAMDRLKPEDRAPSEYRVDGFGRFSGSLTTDGEEPSSSTGWCQLAYWELSQRVGGKFPVENATVNVFSEQLRGEGLCLTTLAEQRVSPTPEAVLRARQKIGLGVTLSRENDGIWIYNRSQAPVFVHSPTLNDVDSRSLQVYRVPSGYCLRAFDPIRAATETFSWPSFIAGAPTGPVDKNSVRISFAKGWGPKYSRQELITCPCWLEVLLSPCR